DDGPRLNAQAWHRLLPRSALDPPRTSLHPRRCLCGAHECIVTRTVTLILHMRSRSSALVRRVSAVRGSPLQMAREASQTSIICGVWKSTYCVTTAKPQPDEVASMRFLLLPFSPRYILLTLSIAGTAGLAARIASIPGEVVYLAAPLALFAF